MSSAIFPTLAGIQWGITKRPLWNTKIQQSVSFVETRIAFASLPLWRWSVSFEFLRQNTTNAEFQSLADFFNARQGMWDSFLYSDPSDNTATDMNFGTGDASDTTFQLGRRLKSGGVLEPIYNLNGAPVIKENGVTLTTPADYTISATGLVTFASAPAAAAALTWTGLYYWRCRFDQDGADFSEFLDALWSLGELAFVNIKGS